MMTWFTVTGLEGSRGGLVKHLNHRGHAQGAWKSRSHLQLGFPCVRCMRDHWGFFFFLPQPCRQRMYPTTEPASNLPIEIIAMGHGWEYSTMVKRAGVGWPQLRAESPPHPHYAFLLLIQPWQAISLLSQSLSLYSCEVGLLKLHYSIVYVVTDSWVSY